MMDNSKNLFMGCIKGHLCFLGLNVVSKTHIPKLYTLPTGNISLLRPLLQMDSLREWEGGNYTIGDNAKLFCPVNYNNNDH
jgi:hypothetical protein